MPAYEYLLLAMVVLTVTGARYGESIKSVESNTHPKGSKSRKMRSLGGSAETNKMPSLASPGGVSVRINNASAKPRSVRLIKLI